MKTLILTLIAFLFFINLNAQITTTTNNSITSTDYVGWDNTVTFPLDIRHKYTTTPQAIRFFTGGANERMRIEGAGNVGIGTTGPIAIFHTVGSGAQTANYSGNLLTNTATSSTASIAKAGLEVQSTGTWNGTSAKNIGLYVSSVTGGTNNYDAIFNGGGNVGIGTTSPVRLLHVNGDANMTTAYRFRINDVNFLSGPGFGTRNVFVGVQTDIAATNAIDNTFVGFNAGIANTSADNNTFIGSGTGLINTVNGNNTFVGTEAGANNNSATAAEASDNTFIGRMAGNANTIAESNSFIGSNSGLVNTTGHFNTFVGMSSGVANTAGNSNVFIGRFAAQHNTSGNYNCIIGELAGESNTTSSDNVFMGYRAGRLSTAGDNTFIGYWAGYNITSGNNNLFAGSNAGNSLTTSADNDRNVILGVDAGGNGTEATATSVTLLGYFAQANNSGSSTITNSTAIGANAFVTSNNSLVLGSINGTNGANANTNVGIGTSSPVRRLHVEADMRLTGSVGTATTIMGRDASGDVSAIAIGSGLSLSGNTISVTGSGAAWDLLGNAGTNPSTNFLGTTDNVDLVFRTNNTEKVRTKANGQVGIGTSTITGKLHVLNSSEAITGNFKSTNDAMTDIILATYNGTSDYDVKGVSSSVINDADEERYNYAYYGLAGSDIEEHHNFGGYLAAIGDASFNVGIKGVAYEAGTISWNGENKGVEGYAVDAQTSNFGGYFFAESPSSPGINYGVWASATGTTDWAAYFVGPGYQSTGSWTPSDISIKQNIQDLTNNLEIVNQLQPKKYEYRTNEFPFLGLAEGECHGLIAQDLEQVIPNLVRTVNHPAAFDSLGNETSPAMTFSAINYTELIPFLIGAIKEQQQQIEDLNSRITSCCGPGIQEFQIPENGGPFNQPSSINYQQVSAQVKDLPVLSQNQPNPFTEKTVLRFYLPKGTKEASIKVYDNTASVHRLFALTGEGPGTIELEGNSLTAGNYYYSLLVGGNVIDTKTMVITK